MAIPEFLVNCITKPDPENTHERITHIGNNVNKWRLNAATAIVRIEGQSEAYYTLEKVTQKKMYVGVVRSEGKQPYLRTHSDGVWNNNLLAQDQCGADCPVKA